jgi:RimJ/RimL family protein N-acetyltransferase
MTEALRALLRFCFDALELHRVEADVTAGNLASAGLLRSLGFTQEGTWRDRVYGHGRFYDLWQFGLLEHEYRAR